MEKSGHSRGSTVDLTLFDMASGKEVDIEALRQYLATKIAKFELPVAIEKIEKLPVTQNGKVRKLQLRKWAEERRI